MKDHEIFPPQLFEPIAQQIHSNWLEKERQRTPGSKKDTLKEWDGLTDEARDSNRGQAIGILKKLSALGYSVARDTGEKKNVASFNDEELKTMARMEHDRWNEEKITQGWTYGKTRNDALKIHDCLVPWDKLTDDIKKYDFEAVEAIPGILKSVGFTVVKAD